MFKDKRKCPYLQVWKRYFIHVRELIDTYMKQKQHA